MFDAQASALIKPLLERAALALARAGVTANQITLTGFMLGLSAALLISQHHYTVGLIALLASRLCDGLDGALARQTKITDRGGFLDIVLDMLFYASIPLAFAWAAPAANALPAAALLACFVGTASSLLAYAVFAAKRGITASSSGSTATEKSMVFLGGLTEASETLALFVAMCIWPQHFALLAWVFAGLCCVTIATRILQGWRALA